jgi:hypothetical protein
VPLGQISDQVPLLFSSWEDWKAGPIGQRQGRERRATDRKSRNARPPPKRPPRPLCSRGFSGAAPASSFLVVGSRPSGRYGFGRTTDLNPAKASED